MPDKSIPIPLPGPPSQALPAITIRSSLPLPHQFPSATSTSLPFLSLSQVSPAIMIATSMAPNPLNKSWLAVTLYHPGRVRSEVTLESRCISPFDETKAQRGRKVNRRAAAAEDVSNVVLILCVDNAGCSMLGGRCWVVDARGSMPEC